MTQKFRIVAMFSLALAGCGKPAPTAQPNADAIAGMGISVEDKSAQATGVIRVIDHKAAKVSLEHGPVSELQWPAMTMGFSGEPTMLNGLSVGNKVDFAFTWDGKSGRLTSITKG